MEKYQTFGPRFVAQIVDTLVFLPLGVVNYAVSSLDLPPAAWYLWLLIFNLAFPFYTIFMHARDGQTFGKMAVKVKVITSSENPITLHHAVVRSLPQIIFNSSLIFVSMSQTAQTDEASYFSIDSIAAFVSVLMILWSVANIAVFLFNDKRRALHDFVAGTVVVKTES